MILNNAPLTQLLERIDSDTNLKEKYQSIWMSIVHFLYFNSGLKISRIAQAGSYGKHTNTSTSDLDVIFNVSPEQSPQQVYPDLIYKLSKNFPFARVERGNIAIHIGFSSQFNVDLVLRNDFQFTQQHQEIKDIRQLDSTDLKAIKIIKYAVDLAGLAYKYPSYSVERMVWGIEGMALELHNLVEMIICQMTSSECHGYPYNLTPDAKLIFGKLGGEPLFLR